MAPPMSRRSRCKASWICRPAVLRVRPIRADHSLRLAQKVVTQNFFLRLLRQEGKGGGKFRIAERRSDRRR